MSLLLDNARLFEERQKTIELLRDEQQLRERFVAILAHDLLGPLTAAKMVAQHLLRHPERLEERRDLAVRIDSTLDRAERMVRDLLDANRIRAGRALPLRLDACDLGTLADSVVNELETIYGERFMLEVKGQVRGIWGAEELRRSIWNLAVNGVKYGNPATPVTIKVEPCNNEACVIVHNDGPALSPEEQAVLFEPFARASAGEQHGVPGWGLGLTLVRGCVEAHGGRVEVVSAPGEGTTFTLRLPFDSRGVKSADTATVHSTERPFCEV